MVSIYLNGIELENILLQTPYKDTLDKELDQLNFTIKSTSVISFKKNDKIRYLRTVEDGNGYTIATAIDKIFCLFSFIEKKDGAYYTYELNMLSPTKLLENIVINGMASTDVGSSLHRQLSDVVDKINAQLLIETQNNFYGTSCQIVYNEESGQPLRPYQYSDFLWDGQQTAREILNDIAYKANRLVIGTDFTASGNNITQINITTIAIEKSGTEITSGSSIKNVLNDLTNVKGYTTSFDSEFANGKVVSLVKNIITKTNVQTAYLPPRNDDLGVDDDADWHILTQEPIYQLNEVIVLMPVKITSVRYWSGNSLTTYNYGGYAIWYIPTNITSYVVEKDVFDAMPITEQAKHLYFKRGEKGIYGLFKIYKSGKTGLYSRTVLENLAINFYGNRIPYFTGGTGAVWSWKNCSDAPFLINGTEHTSATTLHPYTISRDGEKHSGNVYDFIGDNSVDNEDCKKTLCAINYQPYCDSVVLTEKTNLTNARATNMGIIKNQSDRTIEAYKYYDSQKSFAERMGNNEVIVDLQITNPSEAYDNNDYTKRLWELGDYFTINSVKWTCVSREIDNESRTGIKARLTFSESYNAKNLAINENRDKRLYGIPLDQYVDRYIIIKSIDRSNYKCLVRCWDDFTGSTTTQGYCLVDGVALGNDKKDVVFAFLDNYAVGIEKTTYSGTKVNVFLRYCGQYDGTLETLNIILDTLENIRRWRIEYESGSLGYARLPFMNTSGTANSGVEYNLNVKKDKMERIILVFKNTE